MKYRFTMAIVAIFFAIDGLADQWAGAGQLASAAPPAAAAAAAARAASTPNIVENGGFELPACPGGVDVNEVDSRIHPRIRG